MTRINLLPPEVLKRRRAERVLVLAIVGMVALIVILFFVYGITALRVGSAKQELDDVKVERRKLEKQISSYKVYDTQKKEYNRLQGLADKAIAGEILWHRYFNDIAMVIPSDVWLTEFAGEATGVEINGTTFAHNSVADWLLRLSQVKDEQGKEKFYNVWLDSSERTTEEGAVQRLIEFKCTAQLVGVSPATSEGKASQSGGSQSQSSSTDSGTQKSTQTE